MCTTAEGYSNGPSIIQRCEDRRRKIAALRRKIANPSVPMGKRQRLCYELMRLGDDEDQAMAKTYADWIDRRVRIRAEEQRSLCWFFRSRRFLDT